MASMKILVTCLALILALFGASDAREFRVGGKKGSWKIPSNPNEYHDWAINNRFKIGDYLTFNYASNTDSVLEVTEENFNKCNKTNPIKEYKDGNTKIELTQSGPFYFISGAEGHCEKSQKLVLIVMSPAHWSKSPQAQPIQSNTPAPAPAPSKNNGHGLNNGFMGAVLGFAIVMGFVLV